MNPIDDVGKLPTPIIKITSQTGEKGSEDDDPSKHEGRKRSFPHERGIWASYVFIDCSDFDGLFDVQKECKTILDKCTAIDIKLIDNPHLSLSKTFTIRHHNMSPFAENLQEILTGRRKFRLEFEGLDVYVNDERTRTFVGARIAETSCDTLVSLVNSLDECLRQYKLPLYYTEHAFHVSILWCVNDRKNEILKHLSALTEVFERVYEEQYSEMSQSIKKICFKSGSKMFYFYFV